MRTDHSKHIHRSIKRFRIMAITFAGLIAIITAAMIFRITGTLDATSAIKINMAGKQRVLAQRVLSSALEIDTALRTNHWDELEPTLSKLQRASAELQSSHTSLFLGNADLKITVKHSPVLVDAFQSLEFPLRSLTKSSTELQSLTISIIRRAPYVDQQTLDRVTSSKNEIVQAHAIFMPEMNAIVDLYTDDYKETITSSFRGAKIGMVILIGALISILLFVIEPTFLIIRRQVAQLGKAIAHAKQADAARWRLLTNIGHEFRTPMNAIMGFADLLNEDDLSDTERSRLVTSIFDSSTQLTGLIETMLDMSAIESGQLRIKKGQLDLHKLLTKITANTKSLASCKSLNVNLMVHKDCPQFIETDPKRFEQIMMKITDNAVKFTESGCVNIQAKIIEKNNKKLLEIAIADTGIGIPENLIKSIFDPFQQSEDTLTREYGGAGLGLSISREISKALGGNVTVASAPGRGSIFSITIDPGAFETMQIDLDAPKPVSTEVAAKPLDGYKILVVDDAKDNRVLLKHILKKTGAEIEFAMDGKQALDAVVMGVETEQPFDLVLMDMQMPVMDGYFATVKLREQGIKVPIVAVTAHALEGDREHCIDSGCNEYLTKPINKKLLIETCTRLIDEHKKSTKPDSKAA